MTSSCRGAGVLAAGVLAGAEVIAGAAAHQPGGAAQQQVKPAEVRPAPRPALTLARTIDLPGVSGRLDHLAFDEEGGRLFIAALGNGSVEVVDLGAGARVRSLTGLREPQGVAYLPEVKRLVVACGGDGMCRWFDSGTLAEVGRVALGDDADNVRTDAKGKLVLVGYGDGAIGVLDGGAAAPGAARLQIRLPGHPEGFALDPAGPRVFINAPGGFIGGGGQVVVGDRGTGQPTASWSLKDAGRNFPVALDAASNRLLVGCRRPSRLLVLDATSGATLQSLECVGDADDIFVWPRGGSAVAAAPAAGGAGSADAPASGSRVFVIGGDGFVDVFDRDAAGVYSRREHMAVAGGARTGLLLPTRKQLVVAVPAHSGSPAQLRVYDIND